MNKKFFAALASATMAFTASGSIAVFADDFVEEKTPSLDADDLMPVETEVVWNEENFGDLVNDKVDFTGTKFTKPTKDTKVKTAELAKVTAIESQSNFEGEVKGLEYFTKLETFDDSATTKVTNKAYDFSANTVLRKLVVKNAADLAEITLPNADEDENYHLKNLNLDVKNLTSLDLSKQEKIKYLTVKNTKLSKLDLSTLGLLESVDVTENYNLKEVVLKNGKKGAETTLKTLVLSNNALETINLDHMTITTLNLDGNHIGALDLSKTTATKGNLGTQTFYVSEKTKNINLKEAIPGLKATKVTKGSAADYDAETGVLTLDGKTGSYTYATGVKGSLAGSLTVELKAANPMHRLYNPNSGEHFYTADIKEKEALVALGWNDEGYGWVAKETPDDDDKATYAVYRLYNLNFLSK